ncbi:MAG: cysteine hydrolase [Acidimicrobiales bacterium]
MTSHDQDEQGGGTYRVHGRSGRTFAPATTALLVIDPVNDFLSEEGAAWELTKSTVTKHDVVGHLRQLIDGVTALGVPVLYGPMAYTSDDYAHQELHRRTGINRIMFEQKMFLAGSWGADFHPDLRPGSEEVVLQPHKGTDVFQTDLPDHLERLGTDHLVIAGMTANLCVESTGRHAAERGYDVTFVRDAIGAENMPAYEASIRINFPLIGNAVMDTEDLLSAFEPDRLPQVGDDAYAADQLKLGTIAEVVQAAGDLPGHILVERGIFNRDTYVPLDAVVKVSEGKAFVNIPKLVVGKMPWDEPPSAEAHRAKIGPGRATVEKLYGSVAPTG